MTNEHLKVAVVDDDPSVRKALCRLLGLLSVDAVSFASGMEFLENLPNHRLDCLFLDLRMPKMNGFDVLQQLSHSQWPVKTIVMSAQDEASSSKACLSAGAIAYLTKPLDEQTLIAAIHKATGSMPT